MEITRTVSKFGDSWVIKLDKDTRKLLNIEKIDKVFLVKNPKEELEIARLASKLGDSWVIKLDRDTRKILKITKVEQPIIVKEVNKKNERESPDIKHLE